jgi:hypothetical protein
MYNDHGKAIIYSTHVRAMDAINYSVFRDPQGLARETNQEFGDFNGQSSPVIQSSSLVQ